MATSHQEALVQAISSLKPDSLKALGDAIALMQHGDHRRNSEPVVDMASHIDSGDTAFILVSTT